MSEPSTIDTPKLQSPPPTSVPEDLMRELDKVPTEHWPNLLQTIRLFRESVTSETGRQQDAWSKAMTELEKIDPMEQHEALDNLIRSWEESGDEREQTETWEYLRQALDEDRLSNRPLFP